MLFTYDTNKSRLNNYILYNLEKSSSYDYITNSNVDKLR